MNDNTLKSGSLLQGGKYRIAGVLGQGGFGITYEAEQVSLGRKVAVKEFFMKYICNRDEATSRVSVPSVGSKELVLKFKDKFIREARMIAGLDHEHIVKIHDVFEENGTAYYVMEYLGGGSLDRKIKDKGAMPENETVGFIRQIADALSYLHSQNILHFDVKPSNVLLSKNGSAKLIDFGISKHYDEAGVQTSSTPVGISKGYAPLEQYQQGSDIKSFTPATDIYSLGATLYALLSGNNPPEASIVNEDGVPVIDGVSPAVMHTIEKAMQPRRKDRPQSVAEFLALLDGTAKEDDDEQTVVPTLAVKGQKSKKAGTPAQKSVKPQKSEEKKSKGSPKWLYGLIAGVVVAVLVVVLINRSAKAFLLDNLQIDSTSVVAEAKPETSDVVELKSFSLSKTALELEEGSSTTLTVKYSPNNATDKITTWKSTDSSVAKVSENGKVTAVNAGSATIIATCQGKIETCTVIVKTFCTGIHNGHEWVDLGLSVKWATCNVGASSPEDYGSYFAWGETSPKRSYDETNLKYKMEKGKFSKYVATRSGINGPADYKICLDLSDDAAHINWGGVWRMPTKDELQELIDKCHWTWTTKGAKNGFEVKSRINDNFIFLPAAGGYYGTSNLTEGHYVDYLSSSLCEMDPQFVWGIFFSLGDRATHCGHTRSGGSSVRPVCN